MSSYREPAPDALGPVLDEARPSRGPLIALSVLFLFIALIIDVSALASPPTSVDRWMTIVVFGIAAPAFALLALFGRRADAVRVHEQGMVVGARAVRWDEIVEVRTKRYPGTTRSTRRPASVLDHYTIRTRGGETLDLRFAFPNNDAILDHIHERTREPLRRAASLPATFGPITADERGVRSELASLSWSEITGASLEGPLRSVVIRGTGAGWLEYPLAEVPNAHVLLALVKERIG